MAGLQGTWRVVDMPSQFGPKPDEERLKKLKVVVKGDKMTYEDTNPGQENMYEGTINIDPKTKAVTVQHQGSRHGQDRPRR